jgi:integrase
MDSGDWRRWEQLINDHGIVIDRPRGQAHPLYPDMIYPCDYGHVPGTTAADGEELDVFVGSEHVGLVAVINLTHQPSAISEPKLLVNVSRADAGRLLAFLDRGDPRPGLYLVWRDAAPSPMSLVRGSRLARASGTPALRSGRPVHKRGCPTRGSPWAVNAIAEGELMRAPDDGDQVRVRVERGVYRQPNGKYAVCFMLDGKPRFRTVDGELDEARAVRARFAMAAQAGLLPACPRLTFGTVAARWLERFEAMVAVGERRERTLDSHRYHVDRHLLPSLAAKRVSHINVDDIADLIDSLAARGRAPRTIAGAVATLGSILRYSLRRGYITDNPLLRLEAGERPRPARRPRRALGQEEIARLLGACAPRYRPLIVTALYTGMRISELLALTWADVDFEAGVIHVRAQLSRAHRGIPARRVAPKTAAAIRDIPLVDQLARLLREQWRVTAFGEPSDYLFVTSQRTPLGHRNVEGRALQHATAEAGLAPVHFHDLRHTFASHLIIELGLDVAQVSRILGHASIATTLNVYTHLFDDARHATEIRTRMASSPFARLLEPAGPQADNVVAIARRPTRGAAARRRAVDHART